MPSPSSQVISSHDYGISAAPKPTWTELAYCHLSGGLNNQIAHHLFPSTHFSHYPRITRAIRQLCSEEGIAFQQAPGLPSALLKHYAHLKEMGTAASTRGTGPKERASKSPTPAQRKKVS